MFQKHKREDVEDHKQQDVWHQHRNWGHNTTAECLGQVLGLERHTICAFGHTELKIELTMQKISLIISSYLVFQNSMNLPPDKARLLRQYDNEKKWELICDQVGSVCRTITHLASSPLLCARSRCGRPSRSWPVGCSETSPASLEEKESRRHKGDPGAMRE
jgi:hypothetical protein